MAAPSAAKSAERIDGAMRTGYRSPAHLERNRIAGGDLKSGRRKLAQDDARWHARVGQLADDRHAETARAQQIDGARPVTPIRSGMT